MPLTCEPYPWEPFRGGGCQEPMQGGGTGGKVRRSRSNPACKLALLDLGQRLNHLDLLVYDIWGHSYVICSACF